MDKNISNDFDVSTRIIWLYLGDYGRRMHIREISKLLKKNHRTVALRLAELEEKGIVLHKNVGKSKQYFLNTGNITAREYLKHAELLRAVALAEGNFLIKKLLIEILPLASECIIALFGSYAKGTENKESDIDIAAIGNAKDRKIIDFLNEFGERHGKEVNTFFTTAEAFEKGLVGKDHLAVEIYHNHIILNNSDLFVNILWRVHR